jgi:methyl-accepting chemotaxis protein
MLRLDAHHAAARHGAGAVARPAVSRPFLTRIGGRFSLRLVAGVLGVSIPVMAVLAVVLTRSASSSLESAGASAARSAATSSALRLDDWIGDLKASVSSVGLVTGVHLNDGSLGAELARSTKIYDDFDRFAVLDTAGHLRASVPSDSPIAVSGREAWFQEALSGPTITDIMRVGDGLGWYVAAPVKDAGDVTVGVVVGDLKEVALESLIGSRSAGGNVEVRAFDRDHLLVFNSAHTGAKDDATLLGQGGYLSTRLDDATLSRGLAGESGSARVASYFGQDVIAGYAPVTTLGWTVVATRDAGSALQPASDLTRLAGILALVAVALLAAFAMLFARRTTRPIHALATAAARVADDDLTVRVEPAGSNEMKDLAEAFNHMVAARREVVDLHSRTSQELASSSAEQAAAATQTSASIEELTRSSGSVAETVDRVAAQAEQTRQSLEHAREDILLSSERTMSLAARVHEVTGVLTLINDFADQTNLLAVNAAIEAARAGEAGRGFAVVADEVRRLAERSKGSAAEISRIMEAAQSETNATVMAMEKGAKQMGSGLTLMEEVVESCDRVRLTSQQQRTATEQVMAAMQDVTAGCRQVSATAEEIAAGSRGSSIDLDRLARIARYG